LRYFVRLVQGRLEPAQPVVAEWPSRNERAHAAGMPAGLGRVSWPGFVRAMPCGASRPREVSRVASHSRSGRARSHRRAGPLGRLTRRPRPGTQSAYGNRGRSGVV